MLFGEWLARQEGKWYTSHMTNTAKCSGWRAFAAIFLVLTLTWPLLAADYTTWRGGKTGEWNVADNWDSGLPTKEVYAPW